MADVEQLRERPQPDILGVKQVSLVRKEGVHEVLGCEPLDLDTGSPPGKQIVLLVEPGIESNFTFRIVGHGAEVAELAADLLSPTACGRGEQRKVGARFCRLRSL